MKRLKLLISLIFISLSVINGVPKTDLIRLKNGNIITGEIKNLEYGILEYKTDGMSTLSVKWDHVTQIKSKYKFEVTLDKEGVYLAYVDTTSKLNEVKLIINSKISFVVMTSEIVSILKIKDSFWERFTGSFSFGLNYTKGSDILYYDLSGDLNYRVFRSYASLMVSSNLTNERNTDNKTTKNDANFRYYGLLPKYWFYAAFAQAEQNSQMGLDLRTSIGGGFGSRIIYTYNTSLQLSLNLVGNREWSQEGEGSNNAEGLAYLEYRIYNNAPPKTKLLSYLAVYPSFTIKGRFRTNFYIEGSVEIWKDFVYKLKYYYNIDNKPVTEGANKVDWGVTTSFGYIF